MVVAQQLVHRKRFVFNFRASAWSFIIARNSMTVVVVEVVVEEEEEVAMNNQFQLFRLASIGGPIKKGIR